MSPADRTVDLFIGLDLGGTQIKAGLGDRQADLKWHAEFPSRAGDGRDAVLEALVAAARAGRERAERSGGIVKGLCLGTPGIVDHRRGVVISAPANLPDWKDLPLRDFLEEQLEIPVGIENDANCATYAEARLGAGEGRENVLMVTVGTGIGGGAVVDGQLLRGQRGAGMELGHIPLVPENGVPCTCGKDGCLEAYAGGWAMRRMWIETLAGAGIEDWQDIPRASLELHHLIHAAREGESGARATLAGGATALGIGLVAALHLLDSQVIILGGGIVDGAVDFVDGEPDFTERVARQVLDRALDKVTIDLEITRARFGNRAGVLGAIALAGEAASA